MTYNSAISCESAATKHYRIFATTITLHSNLLKPLPTTPTHTMTFLSITLIKIFLVLFVTSHIAIAGPVPDVQVGIDLSLVERREKASGGSVSSSRQAAGGDFLSLESDFLGRSGTISIIPLFCDHRRLT